MNPPPTVGLKTLIIVGLSFVKQLAHGLVKRFAGYVTLLNAFVLAHATTSTLMIRKIDYAAGWQDSFVCVRGIDIMFLKKEKSTWNKNRIYE